MICQSYVTPNQTRDNLPPRWPAPKKSGGSGQRSSAYSSAA
jgi:hypothetical protein